MYCANCGVKLADTEKKCPLCGISAFHPEITRDSADPLYPVKKYPTDTRSLGLPILATALAFVPCLVTLACDLRFSRAVTWSGYVIGAILLAYLFFILPMWFKKPNPVVFTPCSFAAICVYLLYICLATGGDWFLSFAFPVAGALGIIATAVATLLKYLPRGKLFVIGGALIALGALMPLLEFLLSITFDLSGAGGWSFYPLAALVVIGGLLIFIGACRPARDLLERKFFF